jgi:peptidoglycan/LPS O-acetylase OafA/YrhL
MDLAETSPSAEPASMQGCETPQPACIGAPHQSSRRLDIDGIRLVACAAVVVNHLDHDWLPGGFTGVDCFFVVSGYVVTLSSLRAPAHTLQFYARRVRRLMPLSVVVVLFTTFAIAMVLPSPDAVDPNFGAPEDADAPLRVYELGLASLIGGANIWLAIRSMQTQDNYWGAGRTSSSWNPFTHFWSLGVEEQYYIIFPLGLAACRRWPRAGVLGVSLSVLLSAVCTLLYQRGVERDAAYYLLPTRAWELLTGAALASILCCTTHRTTPRLLRALCRPTAMRLLELSSVGCLTVSFALVDGTAEAHGTRMYLFPLPLALPAVMGTACFILAGHVASLQAGGGGAVTTGSAVAPRIGMSSTSAQEERGRTRAVVTQLHSLYRVLRPPLTNRILSHPACVYGGALSYSLYLWHWPVLVVLKWLGGFHCVPLKVVAVAVALILSAISHHGIELPVQRRAKRRPRLWTVAPLLATTLTAVLLFTLRYGPLADGVLSTRPPFFTEWDGAVNASAFAEECTCAIASQILDERRVYDAPEPPDRLSACYSSAAFRSYLRACGYDRTKNSFMGRHHIICSRGSPPRTLWLLGDSHVSHLANGLIPAFFGRYRVRFTDPDRLRHPAHNGWRMADRAFQPIGYTRNTSFDLEWAEWAAENLASDARPGDIVLHGVVYQTPWYSRDRDARIAMLRDQLRVLHAHLHARDVQLWLMGDVPMMLYDGQECFEEERMMHRLGLAKLCAGGCAPRMTASRASLAPWNDALSALAAELPGVGFLNLHDAFCDEKSGTCGPGVPGAPHVPSHFDMHHITMEASFTLWPRFCELARRQGVL